MTVPDPVKAAADHLFGIIDGAFVIDALKDRLRDAAMQLKAEVNRRVQEDTVEWQWADPIPETYIINGGTLHCRDHGDLFRVGQMELWEFALDAKKHHMEHHGRQP